MIYLEGIHLDDTLAKGSGCRNFAGLHCLKHCDAPDCGDLRKGGRAEPYQPMRIISSPVPTTCNTLREMEVSSGSSTVDTVELFPADQAVSAEVRRHFVAKGRRNMVVAVPEATLKRKRMELRWTVAWTPERHLLSCRRLMRTFRHVCERVLWPAHRFRGLVAHEPASPSV